MQNLKRNINLGFRVTAEEKEMIHRRMEQTCIQNMRSYLLKMAVNGIVINVDLKQVNECARLLGYIGNNINQIAKRANETGNVYPTDIKDMLDWLEKIWLQQNEINKSLVQVLDAVSHTKL